jgi:hypothetical protein
MPPETSTLLAFLQLIVLSFTALIYIGQSAIRTYGTEPADGQSRLVPESEIQRSAKLFIGGAGFMAFSGVIIAVYLIPTLATEQVMITQFYLPEILSPWTTPSFVFLLIGIGVPLVLVYYDFSLFKDVEKNVVMAFLLVLWLIGIVVITIMYIEWMTLVITVSFAVGMSLFLFGLLRIAHGFTVSS